MGVVSTNSGIKTSKSCICHYFNEHLCITLYAKSVGKGTIFACNNWLCAVQRAHLLLLSCARWAPTCAVAHFISNPYMCPSQHAPPTARIKPLKTGLGRQQCVTGWAPGAVPRESSASSGSPVPFGNTHIVLHVESTCGSPWVYSCLHSQSPVWLCGEEGDTPFLLPLLRYQPTAQIMGANTPINVPMGLLLPSGRNVFPSFMG